jgi:hypothetical protein
LKFTIHVYDWMTCGEKPEKNLAHPLAIVLSTQEPAAPPTAIEPQREQILTSPIVKGLGRTRVNLWKRHRCNWR